MAKANFKQQKRQRELARKERQVQKLLKRGEKPVEEGAAALVRDNLSPGETVTATPAEAPAEPGSAT